MNVVEAIDAWIDDRIDDLSDAELEEILDLLGLIADSEFGGLDADVIDDDDIDDMVALVDGDDEQINYAHWFFSSALIGEEDLGAGYLGAQGDVSANGTSAEFADRHDGFDSAHDLDPNDDFEAHADSAHDLDPNDDFEAHPDTAHDLDPNDDFEAHADTAHDLDPNDDFEAHADTAHDLDPNDDFEAHADTGAGDVAAGEEGEAESAFADFDREIHDAVSSVDAGAETADEPDVLSSDREPTPDPFVLVPAADGLGPSFLPPPDIAPLAPVRNDSWKRWMVASLIVAGLAVFAYGTVQLIDSLDETSVAATASSSQDANDAASPLTSSAGDMVDEPDTAASQDAAASPAADEAVTPEPAPHEAAQTAIVLSDGSIVLATLSLPDGAAPTAFATVYEPNADESMGAALRASWSDEMLGVVDSSGNVHMIDPSTDDLNTIYVADEELAPAIDIATAGPQFAILTNDGSIWLMNKTDTASARSLTQLWNAEEEEAQVTSITAVADQLAFTLDTGDVKLMNIATSRNTITDLWSSTGDAPAPRIESGPNDTLLWIWEGAISRYRLDAGDDTRVEVVWDPSTVDEKPAIRFSPSGERFAVILQDGGLVLATENGAAQKLWDPTETELRAQAISASADEIVMLLDTGSVLRLSLDVDPPRVDAVWDVTDETLSPARQVAIKP